MDTGNLATITFATTGFTGSIIVIGSVDQERQKIDKSHLLTVDIVEYMAGDLVEPGEFEFEYIFAPTAALPDIHAAPETVTITLPMLPGGSTQATLAGTGFITKRTVSPELKNNTLQVAKATTAFDGVTGPTFTAAA